MNNNTLKSFTVNVQGNKVSEAEYWGYHAYFSTYTNITAIEIKAKNKQEAREIINKFARVLYVFE